MLLSVPVFLLTSCALKQDVDVMGQNVGSIDSRLKRVEEKASRVDVEALKKDFNEMSDFIRKQHARIEADMDKLFSEISNLQGEISKPGSMNEMNEKISQEMKDIKVQVNDLNARISAIELLSHQQGEENRSGTQGMSANEDDSGNLSVKEQVYEDAYNNYLNSQYPAAIDDFLKYLKENPGGENSANAQYWLGECYFSSGKYDEAITEFGKLLKNYSDSPKVPAAYLKIGYSFMAKGDKNAAKDAFQVVIDKFPKTEEARTAGEELKAGGGK
ncbi:MAG: tol-pal system protein YbgF [Candidatus Schekmanbacteria bacterium]|nr:tol-pal system protein YbgF [Candidatus Schekmanbacteria bacterium]